MVSDKSGTLIYKGLGETAGLRMSPQGSEGRAFPQEEESRDGWAGRHGAAGHLNKTSQRRDTGDKGHQQGFRVF